MTTPTTEAFDTGLRAEFEAYWAKKKDTKPTTWNDLFESSILYKGKMPEHLDGVYFTEAAREAWEAYRAATERAAKQEREECAKLCLALKPPNLDHTPGEYHRFDITTLACAAAIRAKGGEAK